MTAGGGKASAGAVEHLAIARVANLADWLARAKDEGAWIYGAAADAAALYTDADLTGQGGARARQRGEGAAPPGRRAL